MVAASVDSTRTRECADSAVDQSRRLRGRRVRRHAKRDELLDVYRDNVKLIYGFFGYSVSHETAEDLTAATFERVVKAWSRFDPDTARPRTWILAIARNVLTDHYRRQSHRNTVSLDEHPALAASLVSTDDPAARLLTTDVVRDWLGCLEPREREVLALRFAADLPAAEVARLLDLNEANVHQIGSRALRRLGDRISSSELSRHCA
jgi:RNA polymerase sigma factor (sigma-70 family)